MEAKSRADVIARLRRLAPVERQAIHAALADACGSPECPCYQQGRWNLEADIAPERRELAQKVGTVLASPPSVSQSE